ncbi:MAG: formate dehydrogenase accessory sulfurtransferase FdhD [Candidatus Promineifilaceae bacterium]|nr:formate dehydrogenase accessory sulfurtransferase FdhD [Candidatus Promineifilaceae bacterium]
MKASAKLTGRPDRHRTPGEHPVAQGVQPVTYVSINEVGQHIVEGEIVDEGLVCISVNGAELATFMCSPRDLEALALGFLYNEAIINGREDVRSVHVSKADTCVDVWLKDTNFQPPERQIVTAGCGGGVTFDDLRERHDPLDSGRTATPGQLAALMRQVHLGASLYQRARGIHTAALADGDDILLQVEDVGRHNCLDKLAGVALQQGLSTHDHILLSSGRISSEMINKARRLSTPIVCSRTSPTSLSVELARSWQICVVAYLRQQRMRVYTHEDRITGLAQERLDQREIA